LKYSLRFSRRFEPFLERMESHKTLLVVFIINNENVLEETKLVFKNLQIYIWHRHNISNYSVHN